VAPTAIATSVAAIAVGVAVVARYPRATTIPRDDLARAASPCALPARCQASPHSTADRAGASLARNAPRHSSAACTPSHRRDRVRKPRRSPLFPPLAHRSRGRISSHKHDRTARSQDRARCSAAQRQIALLGHRAGKIERMSSAAANGSARWRELV